eukprot:scaffold1016_cov175-Ochromonas_danica.AAC.5
MIHPKFSREIDLSDIDHAIDHKVDIFLRIKDPTIRSLYDKFILSRPLSSSFLLISLSLTAITFLYLAWTILNYFTEEFAVYETWWCGAAGLSCLRIALPPLSSWPAISSSPTTISFEWSKETAMRVDIGISTCIAILLLKRMDCPWRALCLSWPCLSSTPSLLKACSSHGHLSCGLFH